MFHDVLFCLQIFKFLFEIRLWFRVRFFIRLPLDFLRNMSDAFKQVMIVIFYELEFMIMDIPDLDWCPL